MKHNYIGKTGLRVSPICLGTMTFGTQADKKEAGIHPVTLATAWSKQFSFVASTIIGATTTEQLDPIFKAMDMTLSDDVLKACDKVHEEILYPMG